MIGLVDLQVRVLRELERLGPGDLAQLAARLRLGQGLVRQELRGLVRGGYVEETVRAFQATLYSRTDKPVPPGSARLPCEPTGPRAPGTLPRLYAECDCGEKRREPRPVLVELGWTFDAAGDPDVCPACAAKDAAPACDHEVVGSTCVRCGDNTFPTNDGWGTVERAEQGDELARAVLDEITAPPVAPLPMLDARDLTRPQRVIAYLRRHPGSAGKQVATGIGMPPRDCTDVLTRLQHEGRVRSERLAAGHGLGPGRHAAWWVTDDVAAPVAPTPTATVAVEPVPVDEEGPAPLASRPPQASRVDTDGDGRGRLARIAGLLRELANELDGLVEGGGPWSA